MILRSIEHFFRHQAPVSAGDAVLVAFSGGPDSTALLWGLDRLRRRLGVSLHAAHLDHGLDPHSSERARSAVRIAERLNVPCTVQTLEVSEGRHHAEGSEAAARRLRYARLERLRQELGARWIATAHHRDDQAETVLLRILFGSGIEGLSSIRPVHGRVVRPLLRVGRRELEAELEGSGLEPVDDPTNHDPRVPRNRIRHFLLPRLERRQPDLKRHLSRLADLARGVLERTEPLLERHLRTVETADGVGIERDRFESLPDPVRRLALSHLHRRAGARYPAANGAREELARQLERGTRLGCDCGDDRRWEEAGGLLLLLDRRERSSTPFFTYTLRVPGELEIPELALRLRMSHAPTAPWMFRGRSDRAALALPLQPGDAVTVRNRRPGDRFHPLGCTGSRRLKDVLIDRRIPRQARDRLPLVCVGERIAWVPGFTIDEKYRLHHHTTAWVAELVGA